MLTTGSLDGCDCGSECEPCEEVGGVCGSGTEVAGCATVTFCDCVGVVEVPDEIVVELECVGVLGVGSL